MTEEITLESLAGVGPVTTRKLNDAGIHNIMDLVVRGPVEIAELTSMDIDTAGKLVEKAREGLVEGGLIQKDFVSANELYKKRQTIGKITTATEALDTLFAGGIETQALTEIYGEFGCGKTQFCHTMCVQVQKTKEEGGLEGGVLYIDSENTFRPERIVSIAQANGMDPEKVLDNIIVARAYNSSHQILILEEASTLIKEHNIQLVVADSAVGLFRSEYLGRGTLATRQQKLNKFVHLLVRLAETYNVAAIATNQVMSSPDQMFGDPTKPVGGNVVAHTSTYRVYLKKSGKKRIARMVDSPHHPEMDVIFALGEAGVIDPEDTTTKKKKTTKKSEPKTKAIETPDVSAETADSEPKVEAPETPDVSAETADSEPKVEAPETPDVSAETADSEPKVEAPETPDVSAETADSESSDLK